MRQSVRSNAGILEDVTLNLPDDLAHRLAAEAARRGLTADETAAELLSEKLGSGQLPASGRRHLSFAPIGRSDGKRGAAQANEILAEGFGRD